jgi:hypothetical protein
MSDALDVIKTALEDAANARVAQRGRRRARLRVAATAATAVVGLAGIATAAGVDVEPFDWFEAAPPAGQPADDTRRVEVADPAGGTWAVEAHRSRAGLACVTVARAPASLDGGGSLSCRSGLSLALGFDLDGEASFGVARAGSSSAVYGLVPDTVDSVAVELEDGRRIDAKLDGANSVEVPLNPSSSPSERERELVDRYSRWLRLRPFVATWRDEAGKPRGTRSVELRGPGGRRSTVDARAASSR